MTTMIYADHAATTQLDPEAFEAMRPYLTEQYGNPSQPYAFARRPRQALRTARETIAACIGAQPEEIFFTSGGTESDNWAVKGAAAARADRDAIVTSAFEHHAVLHACDAMARQGRRIVRVAPSPAGFVSRESLSPALRGRVALVSVMLANNEIGTVQPVRDLSRAAHDAGALFHTDAVQAVGHIPVDVRALGVDMLSASAHKFNGPKGVGFLYVKSGTGLLPYADGGAQERGMRAGTENVAGIVGMAAALRKSCARMEEAAARLCALEAVLLHALDESGTPYVRNGEGPTLPGLLSLSFPHADGEALLHRLDLCGIAVSTGSACNGQSTEISHVLRAIGLAERLSRGTIRVSLGYENTEDHAVAIAEALARILRGP